MRGKAWSGLVWLVIASSVWVAPAEISAGEYGVSGTVRIMVKLKEVDGDIDTKLSLLRSIREIRRISDRAPRDYAVDGGSRRASDMRKWRVIEVEQGKMEEMLAELGKNEAVEEARVEKLYYQTELPNDPLFGDQYGLLNSDLSWADVNATQAWDKTKGSASTVIAVVDGGVDLEHEDLTNKVWINGGEIAGNEVDDDGNGYIDDARGWDFVSGKPAGIAHTHGTHVAGIAAAESDNGKGVAGMDWRAKVMSVRVLNQFGIGREGDIAAGIDYAAASGAKIINLSIAGPQSGIITEAIENAYAAGVVVVAAAGNFGSDTGVSNPAPVCSETNGLNMVIGVGATDEDGEPASFSNFGKCVDVSAPGKRIISTVPGNRYRKMSGTSMSAPLVAGAASLYLSLNPGASPAEVIEVVVNNKTLFTTSRADVWNSRYKGIINVAGMLGIAVDDETPVIDPAPSSGSETSLDQFELKITKQGPGRAAPGSDVVYRIMIENAGAGVASGMRVVDGLDRDMVFAESLSSGGCRAEKRDVVCETGDLAGGESRELMVGYRLDSEARCGSKVRERAEAYADEKGRSRKQDKSELIETVVECG